jgi:hypothetical protein
VVEGYLRIQSDHAGERERRRRRLAALLLDPAGQDPEAVARAAELARWPIPRQLSVLALAGARTVPGSTREQPALSLTGEQPALSLTGEQPALSLTGEQPALSLTGDVAALGPTVPPREAHGSLRWARLTLALSQQGALPVRIPSAPRTTCPS